MYHIDVLLDMSVIDHNYFYWKAITIISTSRNFIIKYICIVLYLNKTTFSVGFRHTYYCIRLLFITKKF